MIWLGCLALVQLAWLPGWLITWRWKAPSWLSRVLVAFGLSLLFNHLLVLALVALGLFHRPMVLGLVGVELLILIGLTCLRHRAVVPKTISLSFPSDLSVGYPMAHWLGKVLFWLITASAVTSLSMVLIKVVSVNPGVFNIWDDFVSFNRWAISWYNGVIPSGTQWYPQLVPANWALAYQITGNSDIQFFVKAVMGFFPLALLLTFVDLFYRSGRSAFLLGLSFTATLLFALAGAFIGSGYVDIPVAFLVFLSAALLLPDLLSRRFMLSHVIIAGALAATAALTKQGGLLIILPLLILIGAISITSRGGWRSMVKGVLSSLLIFVVLITPWYGYKFNQMQTGQDAPEAPGIESALVLAIGEQTMWSKWSHGVQNVGIRTSAQLLQASRLTSIDNGTLVWSVSRQPVARSTAFAITWGLAFLLVLALASPLSRWATLMVVVPMFLIWATKYSYDFRNLTLALPFLGMAWGFGSVQLIHLLTRSGGKKRRGEQPINTPWAITISRLPYWVGAITLVIVATIAYWQIAYPTAALYAMHEQKMHSVGTPGINDALYQYYETNGLDGKIRTMYQPAAYLPKLKDYMVADDTSLSLELLHQLEQDSEIKYVLWWDGTNDPDALAYMKAQVEAGKYISIFNISNYRFVKIKP